MEIKKHKAKVSRFLLIAIFIVMLFPSFLIFKIDTLSFLIFILISSLIFGLILYAFLTVEYIIKDKMLIIKSVFLKKV